jgi:hypothetical protein
MYKLYVDECDIINVTLDIHRSTHAANMDVLSEFQTLLFWGGGMSRVESGRIQKSTASIFKVGSLC